MDHQRVSASSEEDLEPGKHRIEAITDGICAFAATLLVLGIGIPSPATVPTAEVVRDLEALIPEILIFFLSFAVVSLYWVAHHQFFHLIRRTNRTLLWINLAFLLTIVMLPFSTGVVGHYPGVQFTVMFYGLNLVAAGVVFIGLQTYARRAGLMRPDVEPQLLRRLRRRSSVGPVASSVGIAASFIDPRLSLVVFTAIAVYYILPTRLDLHLGHRHGEHQ